MNTEDRVLAMVLRREEGLSVREITDLVGVSRSTVSRWLRDVHLDEEQRRRLRERNPAAEGQLAGAARQAELGRQRRAEYQRHGRALARLAGPLHMAGTMLYWAEGEKASRNAARISNADPGLLRVFLAFLRETFELPDERIRVTVYLFCDHVEKQREIERWWLEELGLPETSMTRSIVNQRSTASRGRRTNMLPQGTCRLTVNSTFVAQSIFGAIQEYGRVERPEWLG